MVKPLVPDDLWAAIEPLLPVEQPKPKGGRPRLSDRAVLTGIMFVLVTGSPWERLPVEMGCGSGMSCWRRLRDWQAAGVWRQLHRVLLERLQAASAIDWSRAALDSSSLGAKRGARTSGRTRRIAASRAPSATLLPMRAAHRSA
jgi:transposase